MYAATAGSVEAMALLLDKGADVNAQNAVRNDRADDGRRPTRRRSGCCSTAARTSNLASKQGRTALFIAAMSEQSAPIVRMLIAKGADLKAKDAFQNTVLTAAAYGNDLDTIRLVARRRRRRQRGRGDRRDAAAAARPTTATSPR